MNPKVSILMATYNRAHYIRESLDSIFAQTLTPHQVILVNDGSTDETRQVLELFMDRIVYLEQENCGKSVALNRAFGHVTGDYVWIFDDDDVMLPNGLEILVDVLERNPDIGFSYGTYWFARSDAEGVLRPTTFRNTREFDESEKFTRLMERNFIPPQIMVRTSCYRAVGPFDPELPRSIDYEMNLRLTRHFRSARIQNPIYYYRQHDGVRGPASQTIPARDIVATWEKCDKQIFLKLRQKLSLQEYLPKGGTDLNSDPTAKRRAYLQRMTIMSAKGLFEELIEDLEFAINANSVAMPLSSQERELLRRAIGYPGSRDKPFTDPTYFRRIRKLCGTVRGLQVRRELGRGLLHRIRGEIGRRSPGNTLRVARAALRLMGPIELITIMISEILKSCKKKMNAFVASVAGTITHVLTEERAAALTFDDGPHPQWTPKLLDILDRHEARATFFCLGRFAEQHPDIVHRAAQAGHAIGNHTYDHPSLPLIRGKERKAQLTACERALAPHGLKLFRPPYGYQSWASRFDLLRLGYEVVGWSAAAWDWLDHDATFMADQLRRQIRPGCIIVLHDRLMDAQSPEYFNRKPMLEALDEVLSEFAGVYEFVTVPELMTRGRAQRQNWFWKPNVLFLNTLVEENGSGRRYEAKSDGARTV